jgi:hypothetical protein
VGWTVTDYELFHGVYECSGRLSGRGE